VSVQTAPFPWMRERPPNPGKTVEFRLQQALRHLALVRIERTH
jgi:hypothetical protein